MRGLRIRLYLESIGLLLTAFGWQCWEEHANQLKYEAYIYDWDQKVDAIWSGVYDEALRSERYYGTASVAVNYDSLNSRFKVWNEHRKSIKLLIASCLFSSGAVSYCMCWDRFV